ncbi:GNAT family N-acetyltransferase [Robertkochia flava]|uniref:GNAT family N-acetyltransferase n=1 Tax=Robertkochia flava TaxID=3447986 RepID=UPI001CCB58DE|nr:GNAT family N-acetyltransferase [Robertkochia marina]
MPARYLFTSERLGFRTWEARDLDSMHRLTSDKEVMKYFPKVLTRKETSAFISKMQEMYEEYRYCFFPVELKDDATFIGFTGLSLQDFEAPFTPLTDIGWRLAPEHWGKGYATEGATRCLEYGFSTLHLDTIFAIAPAINQPSIRVMEKIGMTRERTFKHPKLKDHPELESCVLYSIKD